MPIHVRCEACGHEMTVADKMAGRKGRCPSCDAVLTIPGAEGGSVSARRRRPAGDAYTGSLRTLAWLLGILALVGLLLLAGIGVYTGVTAFRGQAAFHGPFGWFSEYAEAVGDQPALVGTAFILGGIFSGGLCFLVLSSLAQILRLFLSLEHRLGEIADTLCGRG